MTRRALFACSLIAFLCTGSVFAQTLGAVLSSAQETPPCSASGSGTATVTFDSTRANANVTINVSNLGAPITIFHIHEGAIGVAGPVVVNLVGLGGTFTNGTMTGTFPIPADVAQRMVANPGNFYVNVHTTACPGGAARGQLAFVSGGPQMFAAELRGANETPANSSAAFGSALVTFDPVNNTIAFEENQSGVVSPTVSHIHRGAAGVALRPVHPQGARHRPGRARAGQPRPVQHRGRHRPADRGAPRDHRRGVAVGVSSTVNAR